MHFVQCTVVFVLVLYIYGVYWLLRRRWRHGYFARHHIRGPERNILWGNSHQLRKEPLSTLRKWIKEYGSYFGYYEGGRPVVVLSDVNTIQKVLYDPVFRSRPVPPTIEPFSAAVEMLKGSQWRNIRSAVVQCFAEYRLAKMLPLIGDVSRTFTEITMEYARLNRSINISDLADRFALEVLARSALAVEAGCLYPKTTLEEYARGQPHRLLALVQYIPFVRHFSGILSYLTQHGRATANVVAYLRSVIELRREGELLPRDDLLQFLLDATRKHRNGQREVISNALQFVSAFEATGSFMTFLLHVLADHPQLQERLGQEVHNLPDEFSLEDLEELPFLDATLRETLRLFPPKPHFVTRECRRSSTLNGFFFPEGCSVLVPVFHIHRDPQLWEDPDDFRPERFLNTESSNNNASQSHPAQYMPFGLGPRSCVGSRFVTLAVKVAMIHFLRELRFRPGPGFQSPLELTLAGSQDNLRPVRDITIRAVLLSSFNSTHPGRVNHFRM
ncbi:cytochrome P450-like [Tropilaelaps mercedesae]|uniref:Cytochrome P450-like n=1 Tax=Tropilaelaps mercedesae TaxID=418985 RepID=A0A1V9XFC6_9ACAR|nr:cytochrome P450-like [Tropilaelaps mercedesae]